MLETLEALMISWFLFCLLGGYIGGIVKVFFKPNSNITFILGVGIGFLLATITVLCFGISIELTLKRFILVFFLILVISILNWFVWTRFPPRAVHQKKSNRD